MVERPLPGKTLVRSTSSFKRKKAVSRNRQGGNGFFVVSALTILRRLEVVIGMFLTFCICARVKNHPSQTNINRAATNTNLFCFSFTFNRLILGLVLVRVNHAFMLWISSPQEIYVKWRAKISGGRYKPLIISLLILFPAGRHMAETCGIMWKVWSGLWSFSTITVLFRIV